jgi:tetratricopeptide (TPR) repeat protein
MLTTSLYALHAASRRFADGEADMARAAALLRHGEPDGRRGIALGVTLAAQAALAYALGARQRSRRLFEQSLTLLRRLGAGRELAWACYTAGDKGSLWPYAAARDLIMEGLNISRRLSLAWEETCGLIDLAALELREGRYADAQRYRRHGLALSQEHGFDLWTAYCLMGEGHIAYEQGAHAQAKAPLQAALALFRSVAPQFAHAAQTVLGDVARAEGRYAEAEGHYRAVLSACRNMGLLWSEPLAGDCLGVGPTLNRLGDVALDRGDIQAARAHYGHALELACEEPYPGLKLDALARQAVCLARDGCAAHAAELAALVLDHPACANPTRKIAYALLSELQCSLPSPTYAAVVARGRTVDLDLALRRCQVDQHT